MEIDSRINEQAVAIERVHFVKTDKRVNPKKVNPFIYLKGNNPILVCAPRSVRYMEKKRIKSSEEFTGSLAYLLHNLTDISSLAVSKFYGGDPLRDTTCPFREKIAEIISKDKLNSLIILAGLKREAEHDLEFAGADSLIRSLRNPILEITQAQKLAKINFNTNLNNFQDNIFSTDWEKKYGVPVLQIGINRKFRVPHQNGEAYVKLLKTLVDIMKKMLR